MCWDWISFACYKLMNLELYFELGECPKMRQVDALEGSVSMIRHYNGVSAVVLKLLLKLRGDA